MKTITWTAPVSTPHIGGQTLVGGQIGLKDGKTAVYFGSVVVAGKTRSLTVLVDDKPTLSALVAAAKAEFAANVPGLDELRSAMDAAECYADGFAAMMADEQNDGARPPARPTTSVADLAVKFPRAAMYVKAERFTQASHDQKYAAGVDAMKIIEEGGSIEDAAKRLNNWGSMVYQD